MLATLASLLFLAATGPAAASVSMSELRRWVAPTDAPLPDSDFAPSADALPASNELHGQLSLLDTDTGGFELLRDDFNYGAYATRQRLPPAFSVQYTMSSDRLVPVETGLVDTGDLVWNLFFTSGTVWDEPGDGAWSRAVVPFALSERNANCVHNGLILFGFRSNSRGRSSVTSYARFQITQETCLYFKANYWGHLPTSFTHIGSNSASLQEARERDATEVAQRLPTAPLAQLATDFGVDPANFGIELTSEHVSSLGVTVNGVHYVRECVTRTGDYAGLCDELMLPSYSLAKSIFGGLGLMRLAQLNGASAYGELVRTWLPDEVATASRGDWQDVTLLDCLNMMTGNYRSGVYQVDEDYYSTSFFVEETFAGKIAASFDWRERRDPGSRHVYHTTDHFVLATAMQRLAKAQRRRLSGRGLRGGSTANRSLSAASDGIWEMLVADILEPLHLSTSAFSSLRTYDSEAQPYGGHGLWFKRDDLAKIGDWIRNGDGQIAGAQMVDSSGLNAALQLDPANRGLDANHPSLDLLYNNGFWSQAFDGSSLGCASGVDEYYQPFMWGYGGIQVVLLGNGAVYSYVSDNAETSMETEVQESLGFGPLC